MRGKDKKLYLALIGWALIPSIYLLIKMHIIAINNVDINILGQLEWFDLIDETIVSFLTIPLYYLLKPNKTNIYKNGSIFIISFLIYLLMTLIIVTYIFRITEFMYSINSAKYLTLESISLLIGFISTFMIILLTLNGEYKLIRFATIFKIVLLIIADYILISMFKENGSAFSEIVVNIITGLFLLILTIKNKYITFNRFEMPDIKEWLKVGLFSGIQVLLDNVVYALMICKMVNAVNEAGNYWVANNFIWGWLLVPVTCLGEIIRKNDLKEINFKNCFKWGMMILGFWIITLPFWNIFIRKGMMIEETGIINIVYLVMPYYIAYIPSVIFDSWFISKGKTHLLFVISLIVNIVYYGIMYCLFKQNVFEMSIEFVVLLFGIGMIVHMVLDWILYHYSDINKNYKFL